MGAGDAVKSDKVMKALLHMSKLDIEALIMPKRMVKMVAEFLYI